MMMQVAEDALFFVDMAPLEPLPEVPDIPEELQHWEEEQVFDTDLFHVSEVVDDHIDFFQYVLSETSVPGSIIIMADPGNVRYMAGRLQQLGYSVTWVRGNQPLYMHLEDSPLCKIRTL